MGPSLGRKNLLKKSAAKRVSKQMRRLGMTCLGRVWRHRYDENFPVKIACADHNSSTELKERLFTSIVEWLKEKDELFLFYLRHCKCCILITVKLLLQMLFFADLLNGTSNENFSKVERDRILKKMSMKYSECKS